MGPQLVTGQTNSGSSALTTVTVTLAGAITAGNLLVAIATTDDATIPSVSAISDTGVNTWTRIVSRAGAAANGSMAIFVALNAVAGSYGIKFTNGTSFVGLSVAEFNPNGQSGTDGTSANSSTAGSSTPDPGAVTTTNANDSIFVGAVDSAATITWSAGAGYTLLSCVNSNANTNVGAQYQAFSTAVTGQSTAFGNSATSGWAAAAVAIKAAASAPADTPVIPAQIPNRWVGPPAMRAVKRSPAPFDTTQFVPLVTDQNFAWPGRIPNNRVGPMVLRAMFRRTTPLDTSVVPPAAQPTVLRKTLSPVGTRTGSRQTQN